MLDLILGAGNLRHGFQAVNLLRYEGCGEIRIFLLQACIIVLQSIVTGAGALFEEEDGDSSHDYLFHAISLSCATVV